MIGQNDLDDDEISIGDVFHTFWLRKWLLISVVVFITLISMLVIFQLIPRYTAETQLVIGINSSKVVDIEQVISGNFTGDSAVLGEMEVIKSRELAKRVIEKLHLDKNKEFNSSLKKPEFFSQFSLKDMLPVDWQQALGLVTIGDESDEDKNLKLQTVLTNNFLGKLKVNQVKSSQIVNLSYESENSKLAAEIVNEIADQYIIGQLQAKFDATKKATDWLDKQLTELKQKVKYSEQAVEIFRQKHGLINVSKETGLSQQQLSQINSQLIIARAETAGAQAKYSHVANILKSGDDIDSVAEVLNSPLIQSLRQQGAEVRRSYSEMSVEYGKKHPRMIQMQAKLNEVGVNIRAEVKKIAAGLRSELTVSRSRVRSLARSLKKIEKKTGGNNKNEVQMRALEREASANRALFETFLSRFKETASTQGIEQADARVISFAEPPLSPSYPKKKRMLIICAMLALMFAIALVFILEMLNPGVRSPEQIQEIFNMATLGIVPMNSGSKTEPHQYLLDKPQSSLAEAINTLRVSLSVLNPDSKVKTILITSSVPSEGKTTLSLLIARQSAKNGQKVVIVDTDFRRPAIEKQLKIENSLGLTDLLAQQDLELDDVLLEDEQSGMKILTKGQAGLVNPTDLFASQRMKIIIDSLKERFDLVILDTPPVMAVPDARVLSALVDKVIFTLAWDDTPRKVALSALHQLQREGHDNIAGIVLQKVNIKQYGRYGNSGYYYHYSRYGQYYSG